VIVAPACNKISPVNKYSTPDTSLIIDTVFDVVVFLFLINTDLICLEIVEEGADNSIIVPIILTYLDYYQALPMKLELYPHN
jgi:hypothetical protein